MFSRSKDERLRRLARSLDKLAEKDRQRIRREEEVLSLRRAAAAELHALLAKFVESVNQLVKEVHVDLAPPQWRDEAFDESEMIVFQINVSGRVIQFSFQSTGPLEELTDIRVAYTLSGAVRWFNQEFLERDEIGDHRLYYCVGRSEQGWRYIDRSQKMNLVNEEYLTSLFELIV